ncbi:hypothetical protein HBA54_24785 [Pelagibius litoralis]|uniref:DUF7847 domain-containing protein n=1 Tax=Pelagibius litoralis TaxID=374515 RepID=A0A967KCQ7_9PROT|nr:hypothetical protein [Pelagibius litoralis]NIA71817.1 hypothetical protein [Pelagibius litoralis]
MSDILSGGTPASSAAISIGGVLNRTYGVLVANLAPFLTISYLLAVPLLVFNLLGGGGLAVGASGIGLSYFIAMLLSLATTYITMGALVYGTIAHMRGQPAGFSTCLTSGLSVIVPVILVAIVVTLLILLGSMLLIVPGIFATVLTAVAVPAAVVDRTGVWGSVKRSAELTKGNRLRVLGLLVIFYGVVMGIGWAVTLVGLPLMRPDGTILAALAQFVWSGMVTAFFAVFGAVLYHDLRVAKEGINTAQIAAVFD